MKDEKCTVQSPLLFHYPGWLIKSGIPFTFMIISSILDSITPEATNHQPAEATWALLTCADYPNLRAKVPLSRHWIGRKHAKANMATPAIKPNLQKGANHRGLFSQVTCFGGIHQQIYGYVRGISWKFMEYQWYHQQDDLQGKVLRPPSHGRANRKNDD